MEFKEWGNKAYEFIKTPIEKHKRIIILSGSVRSGKTVSLIPKFLQYLKIMGDKGLILIVGVSKDTVYNNVLNDLFDTIGQHNYKYNRSSGELTLFEKYKLKVIGAKDKGSEKYLRGVTLAGAFIDELVLIPENFFLQLMNRCSIEGSKIFATTNPDAPIHYVYEDFINNPNKSDIVESYDFYLDDNPNLSVEYIDFIKNAYTGVYYERFIKGKWLAGQGIIFDNFSQDNILELNYNPYSTLYLCCDFNKDPMSWILAHIEKSTNKEKYQDEVIMYFDELVIENTKTLYAVRELINRYHEHKGNIVVTGDASGDWERTDSLYSDYAIIVNELKEHGYSNVKLDLCKGNPPTQHREMAFHRKIKDKKGRIGVLSDPKCKHFINNMHSLVRSPDGYSIYEPTASEKQTNSRLKFLKHIYDAASYPVVKRWPIKLLSQKEIEKQKGN